MIIKYFNNFITSILLKKKTALRIHNGGINDACIDQLLYYGTVYVYVWVYPGSLASHTLRETTTRLGCDLRDGRRVKQVFELYPRIFCTARRTKAQCRSNLIDRAYRLACNTVSIGVGTVGAPGASAPIIFTEHEEYAYYII
jgi:hypothetical protein